MPNYPALDQAFRLLPWIYPEHRGFVLGKYGAIKGTQGEEAAADYIAGYVKAEKANDEAYEGQRERLRVSSSNANIPPQELPDQVKITWNPTITDATSDGIASDISTAEQMPVAGTEEVK